MAEPLLPYIPILKLPLGFLAHIPILGKYVDPRNPPAIRSFGTLVALGVYTGAFVAARRAKERRLDPAKMNDLIFWVVAAGFIGAHLFDVLVYYPEKIAHDPLILLKVWESLSSYGGFIGAFTGAWLWRWIKNEKILPYGDVINSAFPIGWAFGRAGCASVHDHPGALSDSWIAVRFPYGAGYIGRFDLGLYECLLTIPLAIAFAVLWRRDPFRPLGFYSGWMCIAYAPVRFFLDFLRAEKDAGGDVRYAGLTPAQWACFALLGLGIYLLRLASGNPRTEPPKEEAPKDEEPAIAPASSEEPEEQPAPQK